MPPINYLAVLVSGIAIFMLGGLWHSPVLFAKRWVALQGETVEEMARRSDSCALEIALDCHFPAVIPIDS